MFLEEKTRSASVRLHIFLSRAKERLMSQKGQGTTEYAILVGVLVVIAIVAVTAFKGRLQDLWTSISDGINGL